MSRGTTYYTSYSRAMLKYVHSGFFARDLDADDHAFLEDVRKRGSVKCGSLAWPVATACTYSDDVISRVALIEEMDFWGKPYPVDQVVVRRHGPLHRPPAQIPGSTPSALKRKQDRELAIAARAAEFEEAQRLAKARQLEAIRRDLEWERSDPNPKPKLKLRPFGRVNGRHYVPQWKADELDLVEERRKRQVAEQERQAIEQRLAQYQEEEQRQAAEAAEVQEAKPRGIEGWRLNDPVRGNIKASIVAVLRAVFPTVLTFEDLMVRIGCDDKELVMSCADELINSGTLRRGNAGS